MMWEDDEGTGGTEVTEFEGAGSVCGGSLVRA